jgi:Fe-S-cluster containining protein
LKHKALQQPIRFKCLDNCSNCCKLSGGFVFLTETEAAQIANALELEEAVFVQHYTKLVDEQLALVDGEEDNCVFLDEGKCLIYDARPSQCRTFPFWPENVKTKERWKLTKNTCPGIGEGNEISIETIKMILKGKSLNPS